MGKSKDIFEDQQQHWEDIYRSDKQVAEANMPTEFVAEIISLLPAGTTIVELGCGKGNDAAYFAQHGYSVLAIDFSQVMIQRNAERYRHLPTLTFQVANIDQPFPWENDSFGAVYARLSLHYFSDAVTKAVFQEIHRILKPEGLLAFLCKSVHDSLYGQGEKIEQDMFMREGHVRHFFSEDYAKACLGEGFKVETLQSGAASLNGRTAGFVKVIARKRADR
jgi:SAM-dependent methyltransferase